MYLVAVSEACGGADNLVQDNIVHYADPSMRVSMLASLNLTRIDYLRQAEELAHFAQSTEIELRGRISDRMGSIPSTMGTEAITRIKHTIARTVEMRTCYKWGKPGHLKIACLEGSAEIRATDDVYFILA